MGVSGGPDMIQDGLVLSLDASDRNSYVSGSTTWSDISGNGNNGTLTGSPTFTTANAGNIVLNGSTDYIDMGNKFNLAELTICFWLKNDNLISSANTNINYRPWGKTGDFEARWGGTINSAQNMNLCIDVGGSQNITSNRALWEANTWFNICSTHNQNTNVSNLYVQGVLDVTGTCGSITTQTANNFFFGRSVAGGYIDGNFANFFIYNRVLTASEILQNYNATKSRFGLK